MHSLVNICQDLLQISKLVVGVYNAEHIVVRSNDVGGDIYVTSSSSLYLQEMKVKISDPVSKVLLEMLSSHASNRRDLGWFCIMLAAKLIVSAAASDVPRVNFIEGYASALRFALQTLDADILARFRWSNHEDILCLIRSMIATKTAISLSQAEIAHVSACLLDAFVSSLSEDESGVSFSPRVLYVETVGFPLSSTQHRPATLVMQVPLPRLFPSEGLCAVKVAVFDSSLEMMSLPGVAVTLELSDRGATDCITAKRAEMEALQKISDLLVGAGVQLVCSQKRIHPHLQRLLADCGVVCLPRLSVRYIRSVLTLSGAKLLGAIAVSLLDLSDPVAGIDQASLGYLESLRVEYSSGGAGGGGRPVLVAQATPSPPVTDEDAQANLVRHMGHALAAGVCARRSALSTLVLCGRTDQQCRELRLVCEQVVKELTLLLQGDDVRPRVLPGAGCWQMYVAEVVRATKGAACKTHQEKATMSAFCDALEFCASCVGGGEGAGAFDLPIPSQCHERKGGTGPVTHRFCSPRGNIMEVLVSVGGDMADNDDILPGDIVHADVLDSYAAAVAALSTAVEAALCVLDIDGVLRQTSEDGV